MQDNYEQNDALKESRFSDRTIVIALAVIGLAIPFVLYWKPMLNNNTVVNNDGLGFYYSLQYLSDLLRKGVFPLWNPYLAGGMPQGIMIGSVGVYPLNWLTALFPVAVQLPLYLGLHLAIGACFMFRYLRKLSCSHIVSLAVSLMYIFTVHMGGYRKEHMALLVTAIYVPAILYFAEQYLQNKKLKWLFSCAAAMALQFLGGFLQYAIYSDIMVFLYLLTAGFHYKIPFSRMLKHGVLWLLSYFGMIMGALLGTAQFMLLLTGDSGQQMLFENFKGMSLHPIKLLMTIVPEIFGQDVLASFVDLNYSSGMDAELTLGAATICVLLASFSLLKKSFHVRYMVGLLFVSLIYACMAQFEIVAKIAYHIPVLNLFRVPARTLYLFTFAVMLLVALALDELGRNKLHWKAMHIANVCVGFIITVSAALYQCGILLYEGERQPIGVVFGKPVLLYMIYLTVYYGLLFTWRRSGRGIFDCRKIVSICVMVLMIVQVMPYYSAANLSNIRGNAALTDDFVNQLGTHKIWTPDGSCGELVSNSAQVYPVQGLNAYTNFNLPYLYKYLMGTTSVPMNASGIYNAFTNTEDILMNKNDIISMLGVKYLFLNPNMRIDQYTTIQKVLNAEEVLSINRTDFLDAEDYQLAAWPIELEPDSYYQVTITMSAETTEDQFYIDFAAPEYDNVEQERWFTTEEGEHQYTAIIFSGDCDQAQDIQFRIVALTMQSLEISSARVDKVDVVGESLYQLTSETENYNIYENLNARDLIFSPQLVTSISNEERDHLYTQAHEYDLLNTSYITDGEGEYDFSQVNVEIRKHRRTHKRKSPAGRFHLAGHIYAIPSALQTH